MSAGFVLRGFRSVAECVERQPEKILRVLAVSPLTDREEELLAEIRKKNIAVEFKKTQNKAEKGLSVLMSAYAYSSLDSLLEEAKELIAQGELPVILILDGLKDPHNFGAILRTAAFMGVLGVVIPKDRSVSVTETVYRVSSGGLEYLQVCQETNIVRSIEEIKEAGFWVVGLTEHGKENLADIKRNFPVALVTGSEEKGMRPLIEKQCDHLAFLQPLSEFSTLNASVASALAMSWATGFMQT